MTYQIWEGWKGVVGGEGEGGGYDKAISLDSDFLVFALHLNISEYFSKFSMLLLDQTI